MNKAPRKDTLVTRRQLVDAAEKLFAEKGLDNVSMMDIARAAEQKNRNVLQYHFGDKAGLINAVLDKTALLVAERRGPMLDALDDKGDYTLKDVAEALVMPVAERLSDGESYVKINSQLMAGGQYAALRVNRSETVPEIKRLEAMIAAKMPAMSREMMQATIQIVDCMVFHGLAAYVSRPAGVGQQVFVERLVDSVAVVMGNR